MSSGLNEQETPSGEFREDSYVSRPGNKAEPLPVKSDADQIEDPIDPNTADTDEQLGMASTPCVLVRAASNCRNRA